MGHYQTPTVLAALSPTYYWPQMLNDILHYIKHCDRFGADLVLGLPETDEVYNCILLITEYLT
jgi:hypothetical protein